MHVVWTNKHFANNDYIFRVQVPTETEHDLVIFFNEFCSNNSCKQSVELGVLREEALHLHSEDLRA